MATIPCSVLCKRFIKACSFFIELLPLLKTKSRYLIAHLIVQPFCLPTKMLSETVIDLFETCNDFVINIFGNIFNITATNATIHIYKIKIR